MTTLTKKYWLEIFDGWIEARDMPGPQEDEAHAVVAELKKLIRDIESGVLLLEMPPEE